MWNHEWIINTAVQLKKQISFWVYKFSLGKHIDLGHLELFFNKKKKSMIVLVRVVFLC